MNFFPSMEDTRTYNSSEFGLDGARNEGFFFNIRKFASKTGNTWNLPRSQNMLQSLAPENLVQIVQKSDLYGVKNERFCSTAWYFFKTRKFMILAQDYDFFWLYKYREEWAFLLNCTLITNSS